MHVFSTSVRTPVRTSLRTSLVTAGLMLALSGSVLAQTGPAAGAGREGARAEHMHERMHKRMQEGQAQHLSALKTKLKLSAEQEASWKTFTDAMQAGGPGHARPDRAAMEKLSTPERIDQMQALHAQRESHMKQRGDATKAFYASLSAEQKKTFDAETARMMARAGQAGGHGKHGHNHF